MNQTTKAACNTSVNAALLAGAKSLNISPSLLLEQVLQQFSVAGIDQSL